MEKIFFVSWQLAILADFPCDLHFKECAFQGDGEELFNPPKGQAISFIFESCFPFRLMQFLCDSYTKRKAGKAWKKLHLMNQSVDKEAENFLRFIRDFDLPVTWMSGGAASLEGIVLEEIEEGIILQEIEYKGVTVKSAEHLVELLAAPREPPVLGKVDGRDLTTDDFSTGKFVYLDGTHKAKVIDTKEWKTKNGLQPRVCLLIEGETKKEYYGLRRITLTKME
ncbi:MAG: hypothetical protein SGILL_007004 [Bacillariaceae sp.]